MFMFLETTYKKKGVILHKYAPLNGKKVSNLQTKVCKKSLWGPNRVRKYYTKVCLKKECFTFSMALNRYMLAKGSENAIKKLLDILVLNRLTESQSIRRNQNTKKIDNA